MKVVKSIGLFLIYPLMMLIVGFYAGVQTTNFLMRNGFIRSEESYGQPLEGQPSGKDDSSELLQQDNIIVLPEDYPDYGTAENSGGTLDVKEAAAVPETLSVDTEYVLEETNVLDHTVVKTVGRLPDKYVGMNRERFLDAMEIYEMAPPLSEQERGFVSLEVLSFSRERVVVQMNYRYLQPSESFYLAAYNNNVWVYLEDRETVFIETEIPLDSLPEDLQRQIIQMMWVESEEELYNFLESYSS